MKFDATFTVTGASLAEIREKAEEALAGLLGPEHAGQAMEHARFEIDERVEHYEQRASSGRLSQVFEERTWRAVVRISG